MGVGGAGGGVIMTYLTGLVTPISTITCSTYTDTQLHMTHPMHTVTALSAVGTIFTCQISK